MTRDALICRDGPPDHFRRALGRDAAERGAMLPTADLFATTCEYGIGLDAERLVERVRPSGMKRLAPALTLVAVLALVGCGEAQTPGTAVDPGQSGGETAPGADSAERGLVPDGYDGPFAVQATVLESAAHGPQLCLYVAESYPPQCDGPDVVGWDWSELDPAQYESVRGTRWGDFLLIGAWQDGQFTPNGPPLDEEDARDLLPAPEEVGLETPCSQPEGEWQPVDPERATENAMHAAVELANAARGVADVSIDQQVPEAELEEGSANAPKRLVLNVSTTGDLASLETQLREVWGGALCVTKARRTREELLALQEQLVDHPAHVSSNPGPGFVEMTVPVAWESLQQELDESYGEGVVEITGWLHPTEL